MLVIDIDSLQPVDLLDFIDQVGLQFLFAEHGQNIVRISGTVHERLSGSDRISLLHVDVNTSRQRVFPLHPVVAGYRNLASTLGNVAVPHHAVNLGDDCGLLGLAGLEQLHHTGQSTGDVLGLGGFSGNLGQDVTGVHLFAVDHHQMGAGGHEILLYRLLHRPGLARALAVTTLDDDLRLPLLILSLGHHPMGKTGDLIHLLLHGHAFHKILELDEPTGFGENGIGVRIPLHQALPDMHGLSFLHLDLGAVHHRVAFLLAPLFIHNRNQAIAIHDHQIALLVTNRSQVDETNQPFVPGFQGRLLRNPAGGAANVEGAHGQLGSRLSDGLSRNDSHGFAQFNHVARSQIAAVTPHAHSPPGLAGKHRPDLDPFHSGSLNLAGQALGDLLVDAHNGADLVVLDLLQRNPAHDSIPERLDDFAALHDGPNPNAVQRPAVFLRDDDVLGHVYQSPGEISRVSRLQGSVGQPFTSPVGRDEVLQHGQSLPEIGLDRGLDNFTRGFGHQAAHSRQLTDLLLGASSPGIRHDVNGIELYSFLVLPLDSVNHLVGDLLGDVGPDFDHLVIAFPLGDGPFLILALNVENLGLSIVHQLGLGIRNEQILDSNGNSGLGGVGKTKGLDFVQHRNGLLLAQLQIAVLHQLGQSLFLEQPVHKRHSLGKMVVEDDPSHGSIDETPLQSDDFGVQDALVVISVAEINHFPAVAKTNGR